MARKTNIKDPKQPRTIVVGAGITEFWYLKHLKKKMGYKFTLKPSLFGDESMQTIQNRISEGLNSGSKIICVFDEDVRQWNESERKRMDEIHRKYNTNDKVTLACSMPSIEYWLLLHFENTNRFFGSSSKVIDSLKKHLIGFDKNERYLKQEKWLHTLIADNRQEMAYIRAKTLGRLGESYSDIWKAIDKFKEEQV